MISTMFSLLVRGRGAKDVTPSAWQDGTASRRTSTLRFVLFRRLPLYPPLSLARFSVFAFRPSNLGLIGASLPTPAPDKKNRNFLDTKMQKKLIIAGPLCLSKKKVII